MTGPGQSTGPASGAGPVEEPAAVPAVFDVATKAARTDLVANHFRLKRASELSPPAAPTAGRDPSEEVTSKHCQACHAPLIEGDCWACHI